MPNKPCPSVIKPGIYAIYRKYYKDINVYKAADFAVPWVDWKSTAIYAYVNWGVKHKLWTVQQIKQVWTETGVTTYSFI